MDDHIDISGNSRSGGEFTLEGPALDLLWTEYGQEQPKLTLNHLALLEVSSNLTTAALLEDPPLPRTSDPVLGQPSHEVLYTLVQEVIRAGVGAAAQSPRERAMKPIYKRLLDYMEQADGGRVFEPLLTGGLVFLRSCFDFESLDALNDPEPHNRVQVVINQKVANASRRMRIALSYVHSPHFVHPELRDHLTEGPVIS